MHCEATGRKTAMEEPIRAKIRPKQRLINENAEKITSCPPPEERKINVQPEKIEKEKSVEVGANIKIHEFSTPGKPILSPGMKENKEETRGLGDYLQDLEQKLMLQQQMLDQKRRSFELSPLVSNESIPSLPQFGNFQSSPSYESSFHVSSPNKRNSSVIDYNSSNVDPFSPLTALARTVNMPVNNKQYVPNPVKSANESKVLSPAELKRQEYSDALTRQIEEKKERKLKEKYDNMDYERRKEDEIKNYNPFGRIGAGAPLRDSDGNIVSNLKRIDKNDLIKSIHDIPASFKEKQLTNAVVNTPYDLNGGIGVGSKFKGSLADMFGSVSEGQQQLKIKQKMQLQKDLEEQIRQKQLEKFKEEEERRLLEERDDEVFQALKKSVNLDYPISPSSDFNTSGSLPGSLKKVPSRKIIKTMSKAPPVTIANPRKNSALVEDFNKFGIPSSLRGSPDIPNVSISVNQNSDIFAQRHHPLERLVDFENDFVEDDIVKNVLKQPNRMAEFAGALEGRSVFLPCETSEVPILSSQSFSIQDSSYISRELPTIKDEDLDQFLRDFVNSGSNWM